MIQLLRYGGIKITRLQREKMEKTYHNKYNSPFRIVKFFDSTHILVEFQDEYKVQVKTVIEVLKTGSVKNPYDKTHHGVACIGDGKYKVIDGSGNSGRKCYQTWDSMLHRCYEKRDKYKFPGYEGAIVYNEWLNYQNYARWYYQNYYEVGNERMHVDKDILIKGNRVYSPNTCILVPQRINMIFMAMTKTIDSDLPNGIKRSHFKNGDIRYRATFNGKSLGTFNTVEEAEREYLVNKRKHIKLVAEEYKNIIPQKLYLALLNW